MPSRDRNQPRRILINGVSGSGKTTLAARLGVILGIPHVEIDGLFHGAAWTPREEFVDDVAEFSAWEAWVTEWQYSEVRPMLLDRCDLIVWLDLPRHQTMAQVIRRTLWRRLTRERLWNGNVEPPLWRILVDDEHIVRWAWKGFPKARERMDEVHQQRPDVPVVHLRSWGEARAWLDSLSSGTPEPPR